MSDRALAAIARRQHGLVALHQAMAEGLTADAVRWRLERGRWDRVHDGVYRVAGIPDSFRQRALAACLGIGPEAAASHRTAAVIHDLLRYRDPPTEVTTTRLRSPELHGVVVHRLADLHATWVADADGIPVTTVARTLVDLGAVAGLTTVEAALDRAIGLRKVALREVRHAMIAVARRGRHGVGKIRRLLEARGVADRPSGIFEARMASLLRNAGLPPTVPEHVVRDAHDGFLAIVDFAYPELRLAIEVDGYEPHAAFRAFVSGHQRDRLLLDAGWEPLHFTWDEVDGHPTTVAAEILGHLHRRARILGTLTGT
jgi:predicted transcriptional regulator of viral defense system